MINYIAVSIVPLMILFILLIGIKEKKDIFKLFIEGVLDGLKMIYKIFPYILAITIVIGLFRTTGAMDILTYPFKPLLEKLNIPKDIIPLMFLRPISGGASLTLVMDIFNNNGPDSYAGKIASIIMGGTETTLYCITILLGAVGIKKARGAVVAGLLADTVAIIVAVILVNIGMG